jgi:hypothetical protein
MVSINNHWTRGGTGVTNFDIKELPVYEEAVRQFNDPNMVISYKALPPLDHNSNYCSLHYTTLSGFGIDLSPFWSLFTQLKASGFCVAARVDSGSPYDAYDRAMKGIK